MRRCRACSAPLQANSNICRYCNVRNDIDLHGKMDFVVHAKDTDRICPDCDIALQTIDLYNDGSLLIERCAQCYGLFFDPGEIETMLENSVSGVDINRKLLININRERSQYRKKVRYIKCPVCRQFMRRVNFAHRSGVVIDQCKAHGVWLDNGEITHLMEWKKAGGQMLHEKKQARSQKETSSHRQNVPKRYDLPGSFQPPEQNDLLETIGTLIFRIFS